MSRCLRNFCSIVRFAALLKSGLRAAQTSITCAVPSGETHLDDMDEMLRRGRVDVLLTTLPICRAVDATRELMSCTTRWMQGLAMKRFLLAFATSRDEGRKIGVVPV